MRSLSLARMHIDQQRWARSADIPDRDKLVLGDLVDHADRATGYCHRSLAQIAEGLGKDPNTYIYSVSKSLARLDKNNYIDKEQQGKRLRNFYAVRWPGYDDLTVYERDE